MLLFGFTSILAGILGGASVALLIKHKTIKRLLLISFSILLLASFLSLVPFAGIFLPVLINYRAIIGIAILALIAVLVITGIITAIGIKNKSGKVILIILFSLTGVATIAVFLMILSFSLT